MTSEPTREPLLRRLAAALRCGRVRVVDLTAPLGPDTPVIRLPDIFAQTPPVKIETISDFDERGPAWRWRALRLGEHTGTHFDAPAHWISGRDLPEATTDAIGPEQLIGPACVIDCSLQATENPDYLLTAEGVLAWEEEHGRIEPGSWVLMRTDWWKRSDPDEFLNVRDGEAHTPGFAPEAVKLLARERDVRGVGVETVGTDAGQAANFDPPFPCHAIMHGEGKFGLASLQRLEQLPPRGAILIPAPLRIVDGTGSPCRVVALVEEP